MEKEETRNNIWKIMKNANNMVICVCLIDSYAKCV